MVLGEIPEDEAVMSVIRLEIDPRYHGQSPKIIQFALEYRECFDAMHKHIPEGVHNNVMRNYLTALVRSTEELEVLCYQSHSDRDISFACNNGIKLTVGFTPNTYSTTKQSDISVLKGMTPRRGIVGYYG